MRFHFQLRLVVACLLVCVQCIPIGHATIRRAVDESYDYIVVGGGVAGLTIANRLSEDPHVTVLIIEAGNLDNREVDVVVPGRVGFGDPGPYSWKFKTTEQAALQNKIVSFVQGRGVGGGSLINGMCWTRGSRRIFDAWEALGNANWGWTDLLPYFEKSETYHVNVNESAQESLSIYPDTTVHGHEGPVAVSYPVYLYPQYKNFLEGMSKLGYPVDGDLNDGLAVGASIIPAAENAWNQSRFDARTAYYDPVMSRPNLHLLTGHTVTRILHNNSADSSGSSGTGGVQITGVEYAADAQSQNATVHCKKEVILSAGALSSPVLMQVSGFGPSDVLQGLGVNVTVELPGVGRNLQDHPMAQVVYDCLVTARQINENSTLRAAALDLYLHNRTGPMTAPMINAVAFPALSWVMNDSESHHYLSEASNSAYTYLPSTYDQTLLAGYAEQQKLVTSMLSSSEAAVYELMPASWGNLGVANILPLSRGTVQAASANIINDSTPIIDPRYHSHPFDTEVMVRAFELNVRLLQTEAMAELEPTFPQGFGPQDVLNRTALNQNISAILLTEYHFCGTAAMMPREKGGVVDSSLRVYGTNNLRVVDASIFPIIPDAHLQASVYATAEKAADIIKKETGAATK